jgi:hypothetical protein
MVAAHHAGADKANAQRLVHGALASDYLAKSARAALIVNNTRFLAPESASICRRISYIDNNSAGSFSAEQYADRE